MKWLRAWAKATFDPIPSRQQFHTEVAQSPGPPAREMSVAEGDVVRLRDRTGQFAGRACRVSKVQQVTVGGLPSLPIIWVGSRKIAGGWAFVRSAKAEDAMIRQHTPSGKRAPVVTKVKGGEPAQPVDFDNWFEEG